MPDEHDIENAPSVVDLNEMVGLVGNRYMRAGLSPPSQLHSAVKHWLGLSHGEILAAIDRHFDEYRRLYTCGSGDGLFWMVEAEIRRAWQAKHPPRERADDEIERPRRPSSRVRKVHNASGTPDVFVEGRAARLLRDRESNVTRPSGMIGYEKTGVPMSFEDD